MNADSIKIEIEEDGFHLIVETDDGCYLRFGIQHVADKLLAEVKREIEPWWAEGQAVMKRAFGDTMKADGEIPGDDAYPLYDPKHPDFHENFSALHDNREGK